MSEDATAHRSLRPQELQAVYAISGAVAKSVNIESALDEIIKLTRSVFIFDNMLIYLQKEAGHLEPAYARVIGRGRSAEADLAWGESLAQRVFHEKRTLKVYEKLDGWQNDRLCQRYFLGLPLNSRDGMYGSLVFGRFGGPPYTPDQIHLSEFIAVHIGQLLLRQQLVERIANLEAERRLQQLQANFIATVSHELCTPLGFIKGYATTLLREDTTWDDLTRREFLEIIDEEADRLRDLIDNLLDSSRLQAGTLRMQFQLTRLDTLIREVCLRASTHDKSISIQLDIENNAVVEADPSRIAQVLDNLIANAVKYAPGSVIYISLKGADHGYTISVKDEGPGIAPEHLDNIFERFYRVPESSASVHGTGLGLYICRELIHAHEGKIYAESTLGSGTTFHIFIPVKQKESKLPNSQ